MLQEKIIGISTPILKPKMTIDIICSPLWDATIHELLQPRNCLSSWKKCPQKGHVLTMERLLYVTFSSAFLQ